MIIQANAMHIPLADKSVQCVVTSPPYWGLRDYGTAVWEGGDEGCDHKVSHQNDRLMLGSDGTPGRNCTSWTTRDATPTSGNCPKCGATRIDSQIGLESTPEEYVEKIVAVFREVRRVLRDDGTCWVNLGDSYAGAGYSNNLNTGGATREQGGKQKHSYVSRGTGPSQFKSKDLVPIPWMVAFALQADGWYLRSDIIWSKPNPMPESVTDRPTKSHEYIFLLTKNERYYYDQDAVREPYQPASIERKQYQTNDIRSGFVSHNGKVKAPTGADYVYRDNPAVNPAGRNLRTVWNIATQSFPDAHFATFPEEIAKRCIMAGSKTGSIVLDPFVGSGTVVQVAQDLGRVGIGIDIKPDYLKMAKLRAAQMGLRLEGGAVA